MLVKRRAFIVIRTECTHTVWRVLWWGTAKAKVAKAEIKHDTLFFPTIVIKIFGLKLFSTYAVKSQIYSYSIFHNTHCFSFTNKKNKTKQKKIIMLMFKISSCHLVTFSRLEMSNNIVYILRQCNQSGAFIMSNKAFV